MVLVREARSIGLRSCIIFQEFDCRVEVHGRFLDVPLQDGRAYLGTVEVPLDGAFVQVEEICFVSQLGGDGVSSVVGAGTLLFVAVVVVRHADLEQRVLFWSLMQVVPRSFC